MSHHHSPDEESAGAKLAGLGFNVFGIAVAGFAAFWGLAFLFGGYSAARPKPPPTTAEAPAPAAAPAEAASASPAAAPAPATVASASPAAAAAPTASGSALPGFAEGQTLFTTICAVCHQPTGMGLPNMFPPLAGSDWVNAPGPERLIRIVLHGFQGPININGKPFSTPAPMMPPQAALPDQQIAAVLTYVRNAFGDKGSAVTVEQVKAIREAEKARVAMWDEASLLKVPVTGAQP